MEANVHQHHIRFCPTNITSDSVLQTSHQILSYKHHIRFCPTNITSDSVLQTSHQILSYKHHIRFCPTNITSDSVLQTSHQILSFVTSESQCLKTSGWYHTLARVVQEGNILFNDALNTFYLWLYGVTHMVTDHSDSERGNPLPPHGLLFPISSNGSFICIMPQTG